MSVRLSVCLSPKYKNAFSKTKHFRHDLYWRSIGSRTWAFQRTHYWTPKIQDGGDPPSWKSTRRHFFPPRWSDLDKILQTGDMAEIGTRSRIPIWRTFGRIQWHVIPEPTATLQGSTTWRIQCHDPWTKCHIAWCCNLANSLTCHSGATCHVAGRPTAIWWIHCHDPHATLHGAVTWRNQCHDRATLYGVRIPSAILKIVLCHFLFIFVLIMQFGLWWAAAFVSSPIHLFYSLT